MNISTKQKIIEQVTKLLMEDGSMSLNQIVKITISIENVSPVVVEMSEEQDDEKYLLKIVNRRMNKHNVRMSNTIKHCGLTLPIIKRKHLIEMLNYRNLGLQALLEFSKALRTEGIDCPWMNELSARELDKIPVDNNSFELTIRATQGLKKVGIITVEDLRQRSFNEILQIPNFGKKCRREVYEAFLKHGLDLQWDI